jgi:hypothetical protein
MADSPEQSKPCPPISDLLVEYLDNMIPHRCPAIGDSERSIWMYSGKRELVDFIKKRHEDQIKQAFRI